MADLNGDGLADLVYPGMYTTQFDITGLYVMPSKGKGFKTGQVWELSLPGPPVLADFNGDGVPDFVALNNGSASVTMYAANGPVPDLLRGIDNGIGGSYTISYTPSSAWPNNQKLPFVLQTVSSITANDGNGNASTTGYSYSDGYYDLASREFRGFANVTQTLPNLATVKSQYYTDDDAFKGRMRHQVTGDSNGVEYLEQINTFQDYYANNPSVPAGTHFPCLIQTDTLIRRRNQPGDLQDFLP